MFLVPSFAAAKETLRPVSLQLNWKHQSQFAGYYMAIEKGFYSEAGIELTLVEKNINNNDVQPVLDKVATFGISNSSILIPILNGEPLVIVSAIYQHNPLAFIVKKGSEISSPYQFKDKKIALRSVQDQASLYAMLAKLKIDNLDYEIVRPTTFNKLMLGDGLVDVSAGNLTSLPFLYERSDVQIVSIKPSNYGIDSYGDLIFTTVETMNNDPELVEKFITASIKGWNYALDNPAESVAHIHANYKTELTKEALRFELNKIEELINRQVMPIGSMYPQRFEKIADTYKELGLVDARSTLNKYLINDFVSKKEKLSNKQRFQVLVVVGMLLIISILLVINNKVLASRVRKRTLDLDEKLALIKNQNEELEKAKENAEQAVRVKTRFLSNMSHEIRTPLFGITALTELLDTDELHEKQRKYVTLLRRTTHHLGGIVNDILDYSKITGGMLSIKCLPFSIRSLLADIGKQYELLAAEKNISFEIQINPEAPDELMGDPQRIKQIIQNLCSNAIKFTVKGGVIVSIRITPNKENDKYNITFKIKDSGIGISEAKQQRLFNAFEQLESDDNRNFEGSGLGLSITYQLCQLMNANIKIESTLNKGTLVSIAMAIDISKAFIQPHDKDPKLLSSLTLLLVGSDTAELRRRATALSDSGLTIIMQHSKEDALRHISEQSVDLVLLDLFDQGVPASNFISSARECTKNKLVKILITSNYAEVEAKALIKPAEADAILSLPTSLYSITSSVFADLAAQQTEPQKQFRILLVEDNLLNQELMLNMLMKHSKDIVVANNGEECLSILKHRQDFDVILMDIQMPVMDGLEAMKEIQKDTMLSNIPVIAVTANALADDVETYLTSGFVKHISKPFTSEQLISGIHSMVKN
jgi:signal transduction histidine kinase/CheY-like chemotaxis protein